MTENPYVSPAVPDSETKDAPIHSHDLGARIDSLARMSMVICVIWLVIIISMFVIGRIQDENPPRLNDMLGFYALFLVCPTLGFYGAWMSLKRK